MRRHHTLYTEARDHYYWLIREAHDAGATPTELAKLLDLSAGRIRNIIYDKED